MKYGWLLFCLFLTGCYIGEETGPDQNVWSYELPASVNLNQDSLLVINRDILSGTYEEIYGLIIIKDDHLIFENYYLGRNRTSTLNLENASITFAFAAVGIAEDKGLLALDDSIAQYLPDYDDVFLLDAEKQNITVEHLLLNRGGFSWNELIEPRFSPFNNLNQMKETTDWIRFVLEQPLEAPPGLRYNENTAMGLLLAKIVEEAAGEPFDEFLQKNLFDPLTIETVTFQMDPNGNFNAGDGIAASLLDWTKFGYLMLNNGLWQGRRILDPNFISTGTSPRTVVSNIYTSGFAWQQFGNAFSNFFGFQSYQEIYFSNGDLGQHLYIIPEENMVIAIFATNFFYGFFNPSLQLVRDISFTVN